MIGCKEVKEFRGQRVRWTVQMNADILKKSDKNNDGKKGNDPDNKSSTKNGE